MENVKKSVLEKLLKNEVSEKKLLESFSIFLPTKGNVCEKMVIFCICMVPSYLTSHSYCTVTLFESVCDGMLDVFLTLFGIIFTGFIFFQALLNDELLIMLIKTKAKNEKKEKSKLEEVNNNFVSLMMLYVIAIIISLVLTLIIPCIPADFTLFSNVAISNFFAWILIQIFYIFSAELIWRVLSFVHNIYQLFNAYAVSRIINLVIISEDDE